MEVAYKIGNKTRPLRAKHKGSTSYTDNFESDHPGEIGKLFCYAQQIENQANFQDLARAMNLKARMKPSLLQTKFILMNEKLFVAVYKKRFDICNCSRFLKLRYIFFLLLYVKYLIFV